MQKLYIIMLGIILLMTQHSSAMSGYSMAEFLMEAVHKLIPKIEEQNVVLSPTSIQMLLALASYAAEGDTLDEINNVAKFMCETKFDVIPYYKEYYKLAFNNPNSRFQSASRIFVDKDYVVKSDFNENIAAFNSSVQNVDFSAVKDTVDLMNSWIASETENKIQHAINESDINSGAVLLDSVYFKSSWYQQFDPEQTEYADFYVTSTETVSVPMMHGVNIPVCLTKYDALDVTIIEWGFERHGDLSNGVNLRFSLLLPNSKDGLKALESKLCMQTLKRIRAIECEEHLANITIPKFKIQYTLDWKEMLQELGMKTLFDEADFSSMLGVKHKPINVSGIKQAMTFEVDEKGIHSTRSSNTSDNSNSNVPLDAKLVDIVFDHPFIFTIRTIYGVPLIGHVINPIL